MNLDFGPQLGETFLSARHDFKIDFMQSCKFDFKIDFLQHWANHAFKGARAIITVVALSAGGALAQELTPKAVRANITASADD